jgi:phasin family protein
MKANVMNTDILATVTEQSKSFMAPVQKLNTIAIANTEKLLAFQTASLQKYAQMGMAQWKAAAQVNDTESLMAYFTAQGARMTSVGNQVIADTKLAYQLGMDFLSEAQKATQENVASVTEMTKVKAASRKAAA